MIFQVNNFGINMKKSFFLLLSTIFALAFVDCKSTKTLSGITPEPIEEKVLDTVKVAAPAILEDEPDYQPTV